MLVHTDADAYFDDAHFLEKVLSAFRNPNVIGIAGGKNREVQLADYSTAEYPDHRALVRALRMQATASRCKYLLWLIEGKEYIYRVFTGTNMIGRAYESVLAGGIPHVNVLEDWPYGFRLWDYASEHQQRVIVDRSLKVTGAFRVSERTGSSFKHAMADLLEGKIPMAAHPLTNEKILLDEATFQRLREEALALPHGDVLVAYMDSFDIHIRNHAPVATPILPA